MKKNCIYCGKTKSGKLKPGERYYCSPEHKLKDAKRVRNEYERQKTKDTSTT